VKVDGYLKSAVVDLGPLHAPSGSGVSEAKSCILAIPWDL